MPHLTLEHSANVAQWTDMTALCAHLRDAMVGTGEFPLAGVRIRAFGTDVHAIADGHPDNGFIHMTAKIGVGRSEEVRRRASETIFAAATGFLAEALATRRLAVSFEMVELDALTSQKVNTIRNAMEQETA